MNRKSKGLTLIEMLVVIAILSILVTSLYVVFKSVVDTWTKSKARLDIIQNARVILDQLSRELPGAFVDDAVNADFVGINFGGPNPDTLEFVTFFAGATYKIRYWLDLTGDPPRNILVREYIKNPINYTSIGYTSIDFGGTSNNVDVTNIQFYYLEVLAFPNPATDWEYPAAGWKRDNWDSRAAGDTLDNLPEAVRILLDLTDSDGNIHQFETIVYLPNSTAN